MKNKNKSIYNENIHSSNEEMDMTEMTEIESDFDINSPEYLFKQVDYGINIDNEIIYLHGPIVNCETLYNIMQAINIITRYRLPEEANKPISISINSGGGDVLEMLGIIDYLATLPMKVNIICRGQACSAAAWILVTATGIRAMSKNSTLMLHEGTYSIEDKFNSMKSSIGYFGYLEEVGYKMLTDKTKIEESFWREKCKVDWYLTAEEALKIKLIDKII